MSEYRDEKLQDNMALYIVSILMILALVSVMQIFIQSSIDFSQSQTIELYPYIGNLFNVGFMLAVFVFLVFLMVFMYGMMNEKVGETFSTKVDTGAFNREFRDKSMKVDARQRELRRERRERIQDRVLRDNQSSTEAIRAEEQREKDISDRARAQKRLDDVNEEIETRRELGMDDDNDIFVSNEKLELEREKASLETRIAQLDKKIGDK